MVPRRIVLVVYMGVSKNRGTPKSSILIGISIINHPFWGTTIVGNTHIPQMKGTDPIRDRPIFHEKTMIMGGRVLMFFFFVVIP